jgi:hypothetical protein
MSPTTRFAGIAALVVLGATACTDDGASRNQVVEAMENAGLPSPEANCVGNTLDLFTEQEELDEISDTSDLDTLSGVPRMARDDQHFKPDYG